MIHGEYIALTVIAVTTVLALVVLALGYWYIMKQDATVLTTISAAIGGIAGYAFKTLIDIYKARRR